MLRRRSSKQREAAGSRRPHPLELYRWATQDPIRQVQVLEAIFERLRPSGLARVLREDFAGTAADAVGWVSRSRHRRALAVELDQGTLAWARWRARRLLGGAADRIGFVRADVGELVPAEVGCADIVTALNFSVFGLHDRRALRGYFRLVREGLTEGGLMVLNAFGGPGAMRLGSTRRWVDGGAALEGEVRPARFGYEWEQRRYDAVSNRVDCRIHFELPGEGRSGRPRVLRNAFRYDWRLWTLPELVEVLGEAGFAGVQVWRHRGDPDCPEAGVSLGPVEGILNLEVWVAYVVASAAQFSGANSRRKARRE